MIDLAKLFPFTFGKNYFCLFLQLHPLWDVWVEIKVLYLYTTPKKLHPLWDVWVEITTCGRTEPGRSGYIHYGMYGLKLKSENANIWHIALHPLWDVWVEM